MSNDIKHPLLKLAHGAPLTSESIHEKAIEDHLDRIKREFHEGFEFLQKYPRSVTVFGSSMVSPDDADCKQAFELSKRIVKELKYAIVTGGGPGIMEAAAHGATEAGGDSVGLRINLTREQPGNDFTSDSLNFSYFFTRKTLLAFAAEAYVFFPGGYGTFDELFGILTLVQTNKIPRVPIILFGSSFWNKFKAFLKESLLGEKRFINKPDLELFEITDDYDRVLDVIKKGSDLRVVEEHKLMD